MRPFLVVMACCVVGSTAFRLPMDMPKLPRGPSPGLMKVAVTQQCVAGFASEAAAKPRTAMTPDVPDS